MGPTFGMERAYGALWIIMDELDEMIAEQDSAVARDVCTRLLELLEKLNAVEERCSMHKRMGC